MWLTTKEKQLLANFRLSSKSGKKLIERVAEAADPRRPSKTASNKEMLVKKEKRNGKQ